MSAASICILYTQDADLARRVKAFLRAMALIRHVIDPNRMEAVLQQNSPAVILMDLRAKECRDLLEQLEQDWPESLVIALGAPRSEPLREAEQSNIYAAEDLQLDRHRFQTLAGRAFDHLKIMQENRDLREESLDRRVAEVLVPPDARPQIVCCRFFRHRIPGLPFDAGDVGGLMILAEHLSTVLHDARLYEEVALQKTLAETLLKSIPPGIVAID